MKLFHFSEIGKLRLLLSLLFIKKILKIGNQKNGRFFRIWIPTFVLNMYESTACLVLLHVGVKERTGRSWTYFTGDALRYMKHGCILSLKITPPFCSGGGGVFLRYYYWVKNLFKNINFKLPTVLFC